MRLTASFAVLQLLLLNSATHAAFAPRHRALAPITRLNAGVDPIVAAYQSKGSAYKYDLTPTLPAAAPATPAPAVDVVPAAAAPPADVSSSAVDATADKAAEAAAQAQEAASQAAQAASDIASQAQAGLAAISAKAAAASKAAAAAQAAKASAAAAATAAANAPPAAVAEGKAPTLAQFLRVAPTPAGVSYAPSGGGKSLAEVQAKIELLGTNMFGEDGVKAISSGASKAAQSVSSGGASVDFNPDALKGAVVGAGSAAAGAASSFDASALQYNIQNLAESLRLSEYGAWYATGAALIFAAYQRQAGRNEARKLYEDELALAQARADEAAAAAGVAAQGAALAKTMAAQAEKRQVKKSVSSEELLESSRVREMEAERNLMREQLSKVTSETVKLRSMLDELIAARDSAGETVFVEPAAPYFASETDVDRIPVTYMTMARDPDEDARILAVIKEMDEENLKGAAQKTTTKKEKAAAKSTKSAKESAAATTTAAAASEAAPAKSAKKTTRKKSTKTAKTAKKVKRVSKRAKAAPKKVETVAEAAEEIKVEKKAAPKKKTAVVMADDSNPWAALSDSTLKRKTVAQLTEYLAERSVTVSDDSGKAPKKAELVSAVRSL